MLANLMAFFLCESKQNALHGESGRYMGLLIYLMMCLVFFLAGNDLELKAGVFYVFALTSAVSLLIAIGQHLQSGHFPFSRVALGLKERLSGAQYNQFVSTFGNINIFAGFLCVAIPVFIGMFVFLDSWHGKLISAVLLVLSGFCIFVANSDSTYFGIAASAVLILLLAIWYQRVLWLCLAFVCLAIGNLWVELANTYSDKVRYDKNRGGMSLAIGRLDYAVVFLVAMVLLAAGVFLMRRFLSERLDKLNRKLLIAVILAVLGFGLLVMLIYLILVKKMFPLDYKWGTYRGYIWTKMVEIFRDAPLTNKLFGYGQESVRSLVEAGYYEEMLEVTGRTYDNAHNELLQYLITTGLCGVISYVGAMISSIVYILRHAKGNPVAYISLFAVIGYLAQSLISLNQPITTPLLFVFLAMGMGTARHMELVGEPDQKIN